MWTLTRRRLGRMFMPGRGFENQFLAWTGGGGWQTKAKLLDNKQNTGPNDPNNLNYYPFVSDPITLGKSKTKFGFTGGEMTIEIYSRHPGGTVDNKQDLVQSIRVFFPDVTGGLPVPKLSPTNTEFQNRLSRGINGNRNNLGAGDNNSGYRWIETGDVIRSIDLGGSIAKGDARLVALNPKISQKRR